MRRDDHIDVLRGVAILLILILHAGALAPGLEDRRYLQIVVGRMGSGMQLFFVLSGYLIARSWEETRRSSNALSIFAIKRIGKIGACQKFCVRGGFHGRELVNRSPYRIAN